MDRARYSRSREIRTPGTSRLRSRPQTPRLRVPQQNTELATNLLARSLRPRRNGCAQNRLPRWRRRKHLRRQTWRKRRITPIVPMRTLPSGAGRSRREAHHLVGRTEMAQRPPQRTRRLTVPQRFCRGRRRFHAPLNGRSRRTHRSH
jgi:hypothetical protein